MEIDCYLAMTAAEMAQAEPLPPKIAWMSCHFSPYGRGLSNLPDRLPQGSLLMLTDRTPWWNHDGEWIARQLAGLLDAHACAGLLLDFQRPDVPEVAELAGLLSRQLSCPVGVSELYAGNGNCPVFLPPIPLGMTVSEYLQPWQGREIWLDMAPQCCEIRLSANGSTTLPLPYSPPPEASHRDDPLHCRYTVEVCSDRAIFTLYHTREDLIPLLEEAKGCGVTTAVGLWQELEESLP